MLHCPRVNEIRKYPRTPHIEGSRFQPGDEDLDGVAYQEVVGRFLVVEEKLDGANSGLSFDENGQMWLQSRGHFLTGGPRERHFDLFKRWSRTHQSALWELLGSRYIVYGEWLYAKHTIFYDCLPHYFLEFDVFDKHTGLFLSTQARRQLLHRSPIRSVPVIWSGLAPAKNELAGMIQDALYRSSQWHDRLKAAAVAAGQDPERIWRETDHSPQAEGLYLKVEDENQVLARYKFVRASFLTSVLESESHWLDRPIIANRLADETVLWSS